MSFRDRGKPRGLIQLAYRAVVFDKSSAKLRLPKPHVDPQSMTFYSQSVRPQQSGLKKRESSFAESSAFAIGGSRAYLEPYSSYETKRPV